MEIQNKKANEIELNTFELKSASYLMVGFWLGMLIMSLINVVLNPLGGHLLYNLCGMGISLAMLIIYKFIMVKKDGKTR